MTTANQTIQHFVDALAARQSMPGGGAAAAVTGAQAAALVSMVINFTLGNKKYADVEAEMQALLVRSEQIRADMLKLADRDIEAFNKVAAGYALPRASDEEKVARSAAIQTALKGATMPPFELAERCLDLLKLIAPVGVDGNPNVVSDAATALYLASGALHSAIVNVNINLKLINDPDFVVEWAAHRDELLDEANAAYHTAKIACERTLGVGL